MNRARTATRLLCTASAAALALGLPSNARAADLYWDANGTAVGSGGTGIWDNSGLLWSQSNSDILGPYQAWNNAALDNAIFGTTAAGTTTTVGTITLGTPITVHNMTFQSVNGWTVSGGTLTLAGATPTINTVGNTTINSVVAGTDGLRKIGGGQLYLTGSNTFSGGISLGGGTLRADDNAALGDAGNLITVTASSNLSIDAGDASSREVSINSGVTLSVSSNSAGTAHLTGAGNVSVAANMSLTNDANSYTGLTRFFGCNGVCASRFSSIADLGVASALGAPTTVAEGTIQWSQSSQYSDYLIYTGDGDSSNRNWNIVAGSGGIIRNDGTGTLTLTGDVTATGSVNFQANTADFDVLGVLGGGASYTFTGGGTADVTLGGANIYTGATGISGGLVNVPVLADQGVVSSLGTASAVAAGSPTIRLGNGGILSYTGTGASSDRSWQSDGITQLRNDGSGDLNLSGNLAFVAGGTDSFTLGGGYAGTNSFAGVISGAGNLGMNGAGTWILSGANTRSGTLTVTAGTLQAGSASAFGTVTGVTVNGGTLALDGFDLVTPTLNGAGGTVDLGTADLAVNGNANSSYAGSITGSGGLNKEGNSVLTLTGASTYSGDTSVGGGTLRLDFSGAGGPTDDIIASASTLNMAGGTVNIVGAAGEANTQTFDGLNITAGANTIDADAGAGGSITLNLGAINRTGGLVNFNLPTSGNITTTNLTLGGWATVNATDYAKVVGGNIVAFTDADYTDQDDASLWASGQYISDSDGDADSYFGTVGSSVQLAGLQFTTPDATTTVTVAAGQTLGVDGTIIVAPSVLNNNQTITGGNLTGASGGGGLVGIQQNGGGTFTINSTIVDNAGSVGFTKGGTGAVSLTGANSYTGATTLSAGRLVINSVANGGSASAIGASTADSSNLVLEGGTLAYTGGIATSDRGFTLVNGGAGAPVIEVTNGAANLTFTGQVVSPDDAGLTKTGAGTLTLANGGNNYVGVTTVSGGTLSVDDLANGGLVSGIGAATAASSNLILQTNGELEYTGGTTSTNRGFTLASGQGRIDVSQAATTLTMSGVATGSGTLVKNGDGTLILSGNSNYTGGTIVNAGTLRAGSLGAFGVNTNLLTVNTGALADLTALNMTIGALGGGGTVDLGTRTLTLNGNNGTFTGTIIGTGGLLKGGSGSQTINGCNNSYTGITDIRGALFVDCLANGGLASGIGASSSASSNLIIRDSGNLVYTGATTTTDRGFTLQAGAGYVQVNNAATELTFSGVVTGPGTLIKRGAGVLTLSGANNYTGNTQVEGGILRAGSATAFGTGAGRGLNLSNTAGAALDLNNFDMSFGFLTGGGPAGGNILLGSGTLTLTNPGGAATYAGAISGEGGLVLNSALTQGLTNCNSSYSGGTTIMGGGTVQAQCLADGGLDSSIGSSGAAASNLVLSNGTLRYVGAGGSTNRQFTMGGNARLDSSGTGAIAWTSAAPITQTGGTNRTFTLGGTNTDDNVFAGQIDNPAGGGVVSLAKVDGGNWRLSNPNSTYTGTTTISGGVLSVDHLNNGGVASSIGASGAGASNLIIGTGGTLRYTGTGDSTDRQFRLGVGTTFIESSGTGAINFTSNAAVTYTGNGTRVFGLGGTNSGDNIMGASIGNQSLANFTSLAKNDSGKWILTGTNTYTGPTNVNAGTLIIGNGGTAGSIASGTVNNFGVFGVNQSDIYTYAGVIQGTGSFEQLGTGTTILTGTSTYTGGTTIAQGTLELGNGGTTGSIVGDVVNNGRLAFNRSNLYQFDGTISGTGRVVQQGSGTTILTATNSYSGGTDINGGTLQISSDANLGAASGGLSFNGGTLETTADITSGRAIDLVGGGTFLTDPGTTLTLTGIVSGVGSLTKTGDGTLTLTADNSYTGLTTVSAGTLNIGAGGTSGSIAGDLANNATVNFNRSDTLTYAGDISGTGAINQNGSGTLILSGTGSYSGGTNVNAGALLVNGDLSGATGLMSVAAGASLGGTGVIGGDVTLADGSTLEPGSPAGAPGALTINGNLSLSAGTAINFELGAANAVGDPLNDLVDVGGDLALDGTLNVAVPAGGSFDIGLYRIFNYGGALTDNGLEVGTLPPGGDAFIQTSIAGQVNLINTAGVTLNYWDGAAGPKFNGAIDGGDGVWQNSTGNDNWADATGAVNATFSDGAFAIFSAASGTVTVDNSLGQVTAMGMQFASDGYVITGQDVALVGPQSVIRVGDGTLAGAGYTATIDSALTGATELVKTDLGTLVLTGVNTYAGGTLIDDGTLQIASDANLGDAAGDITIDGATLHATADITTARAIALTGDGTLLTDPATTMTANGVVSGAGALTKDGDGSLVLTADNSYAGGTTILAGLLQLGDGGISGGIVGDVVNNGTLAFNRSDVVAFAGAISGSGSVEQIGSGTTILTADNSYAGGTTISSGILQLGDGGTTGSIVGDVVNNATLAFNRSDAVTFDGLISGTGTLNQNGSGIVTLTGANSYTGLTNVNAGTLLVNGDQSAATGLTSVASGAALGGTGTIGGDVAIADGATLTPGSLGVGTLAINGNLSLAGTSLLDFEFGEGSVVGGPLNDLVEVGGDLALDGTIDVTVTPGGSFDVGIYRIASYGGTLTDGGLALGTMPAGSNVFVQTSVANQVNLVNFADLTLRFWDGAAGPKNDGAVNGGDGVWQNSTGNDNWTDLDGAINAPYTDGAFAVFMAAPGTVTVDNNLGQVTASGMQFASDGYLITGGDLALTGPQSTIRVGDGTAAGAGFIATIDSRLTGATELVKADLGTLVLIGANSYSGGTTIADGTLQIGNGGTSGSIVGDVFNNATLAFNRSDLVTFGGAISGTGVLNQDGSGTLTLTGTGSYTGGTNVNAGTLLVNGDLSGATGPTSVAAGAALGGTGTIGGNVSIADGGTLEPGAGAPGVLTIDGNLTLASGSMLNFEFGAANAVDDPLNDRVDVGGDLALDGTINVSVPAGGSFNVGLYRVFNYGGTLTDNGLTLGMMPAGSDVSVQTSVAGQVNLINTGGLTLNFWDGAAGPKFNDVVNGGDGLWQDSSGNDNWTDASGAVNAPFTDAAFAIFTGAPGTVSVDNSLGAVSASGMQFAVDGYLIAGDTLTLVGPQSTIRVGDGTAPGAGMTATIDTELAGATELVKTDLGTLVLTGTNSYTGGTTIDEGRLQLGNGGATGTILGNVVNHATLAFNRSDIITFDGLISGTGAVDQLGTGTTILTAASSFTGGTNVNAGTLLVNGDLSGATGPTTVASGAALGGIGTIGGDVAIADGGVLQPGSGGVGLLTISGDLGLSSGSLLDFELGQADAVGGPLNDLIEVGGDLTLDGTVNVSVPAGGSFDFGIYRLINYGGTLTDNGLDLGIMPAGSNVRVQTAVAGQVNLINGGDLNFWDGNAGPKSNGEINGGDGLWQNAGTLNNWTTADGSFNGPWADAEYAIFAGAPGTVTVDNSLGDVRTAGMQFAVDGYVIAGDPLTLVGPQTPIRVGDGTSAGAGFVTTIAAELTGDAELVKTDLGTLVLTGTNSYTGGTAINGGTVQISSDANLGDAAGDLSFAGGTLHTTADLTTARDAALIGEGSFLTDPNTTLSFDGVLSGTGDLNKAGAGTMVLTADSSGYSGNAELEAGTMVVNGILGGTMSVLGGARLEGTGTVGATTLKAGGTVAPGVGGIGTLTVDGDWIGAGGTLAIDAVLGNDSSPADLLLINGSTSGNTMVTVNKLDVTGEPTVEGIRIVDVAGASDGSFTLVGDYQFNGQQALIAGAFAYTLQQNGVSTPTDGDWYLRSSPSQPGVPGLFQPGVPLYESYGDTMLKLDALPTWRQRVGKRYWAPTPGRKTGSGLWGRIESDQLRPEAAVSTSLTDIDTDFLKLQFGFDKILVETGTGALVGGLTFQHNRAEARIHSVFGDGEADVKSLGVGGTLTWYSANDFYVDAQAQLNFYEGDLRSDVLGQLADDNKGWGHALGIEAGRSFGDDRLSVTPQVQLVYASVNFDRFTDPNGADLSLVEGESLKGRLGATVQHAFEAGGESRGEIYGLANLNYEFLDGARTDVSGTDLSHRDDRLWGEVGLGANYRLGRWTFYGEASARTSMKDVGGSYGYKGEVGLRFSFR